MSDIPPQKRPLARTLLFAIAATWLFLAAFMRTQEDSVAEVIGLVQRIAFGVALMAAALIDWQWFRWWWLLIALLLVAIVWTATGHPLLFGFGFT
jgi:hypothetical protein